jgi:hypothetical protein
MFGLHTALTLNYRAMWLILFFVLGAQAPAPTAAGADLDFQYYKTKVEPLFLEKRPGHARCIVCHSTSTAFRLQQLAPGAKAWTDEQSQKNFETARKFVVAGKPQNSRLLLMPLSHEAGGTEFHPGGKHWESRSDPEWKVLEEWVKGAK